MGKQLAEVRLEEQSKTFETLSRADGWSCEKEEVLNVMRHQPI